MLEVTITSGHSVMGVHRTSKRARAPTSVEYAAAAGVVIEGSVKFVSKGDGFKVAPARTYKDETVEL